MAKSFNLTRFNNSGNFLFRLISDDGSKLFIDDLQIINNDGIHSMKTEEGEIQLSKGFHKMRVEYFQGPKYSIGLILQVIPPTKRDFQTFRISDFSPVKIEKKENKIFISFDNKILFESEDHSLINQLKKSGNIDKNINLDSIRKIKSLAGRKSQSTK